MAKYKLKEKPYKISKTGNSSTGNSSWLSINLNSGLNVGDKVVVYRKNEWIAIVKEGEKFNADGWMRRGINPLSIKPHPNFPKYMRISFPSYEEIKQGELFIQYKDEEDNILYLKKEK